MIKKLQLKNGLSVLLVESHKSPVVSVQLWVRTGSADEKPRHRGVSHFIEHLVFKGSDKFNVGEIASVVEGSGGELNAYTSFDQTVFYVTISSQYLDVGLDVISQMAGHPTFVPEEIENEREVVIEEIKRSNDSLHRQGSRLLFESLYRRHPYGEPVIGYEEIIRKISRDEIAAYFNDRYGARNMHLLLVGDFSTRDVKTKLESYFSTIHSGRGKRVKRSSEPESKRPRVVVRGAQFEEDLLYLAWPIPKAEHRDIAALEVLALIWGQGDSSRLAKRLRFQETLVNGVGSSLFAVQDPGFFAVSASLPSGQQLPALNAIREEWENIIQSPPTREEVAKAVINLHSEQYYSLETVDGMARKFGHFENLFKDYRYFDSFLKQVRSLKPEHLQKAAKKYLTAEKLTLCSLVKEADRPSSERELKEWMQSLTIKATGLATKKGPNKGRALPRSWFPKATASGADHLERVELKSGAILLLRPNFDTPVMSLRAGFAGGSRLEAKSHQGLNELLSRVWVSETKRRSEAEVLETIETLAGSISGYGGRNSAGLTFSALHPFSGELLELFGEILTEVQVSEEIVNREKKLMQEQLKVRLDNPAQMAITQFMTMLFGEHPYGRDPIGRMETLGSLGVDEVVGHLTNMRVSRNLVLGVTGYFNKAQTIKQMEELTAQLLGGQRLLQNLPLQLPNSAKRQFLRSEKEQVHIVLGYPGLSLTDPDRYALQVLEAVLAGQGGRLFVELRDRASLAYSVSPLRLEGVETGYFGAYIGCSPEKGARALKMLREQLARVRDQLIPNDELSRAQKYLVGRHDIDLQRNSTMAASLLFDELYGLGKEETFLYPDRIRSVTNRDVLKVAESLLAGPEVISAVGPREPWSEGSKRVSANVSL